MSENADSIRLNNSLIGMNDYLYTLSPFTDEGMVLSESHLLRVLKMLDRTDRLSDQTVHVYEERAGARIYKGKIDAVSVLKARGVDFAQIEQNGERPDRTE